MIDALERIEEPEVAHAAWHEALRDNPVSAAAIWAAVDACGGRRRAHHFGVLIADLTHAEQLLAHDAREARTRGPGERIVEGLTDAPRSRFFCAPNGYLEAHCRERLFAEVFGEACAYLRRRTGGRDVHGRLLVDAVTRQLIARWLSFPADTAPARDLIGHVSALTAYAFTPCPSARARAEAQARRDRVWDALGTHVDGPVLRWFRADGGCASVIDERAAVLDTLCELCGPATEGTLSILHEWLESGSLWLESAALRRCASAERRPALVHAVRAASSDAPTPLLVPLRTSRGNPLHLAEDSLVVIGLGAALATARDTGRKPQLPWFSPAHALGTPHEHFAAGILGAVLCCRTVERAGPLQFRFESVDELAMQVAPQRALRRFFFWRKP